MKKQTNYQINLLMDKQLSYDEAVQLLHLIKRLKFSDEDFENYDMAYEEPIPFEGGISLEEALIGAQISIEDMD
jgi:hypothetical protein